MKICCTHARDRTTNLGVVASTSGVRKINRETTPPNPKSYILRGHVEWSVVRLHKALIAISLGRPCRRIAGRLLRLRLRRLES